MNIVKTSNFSFAFNTDLNVRVMDRCHGTRDRGCSIGSLNATRSAPNASTPTPTANLPTASRRVFLALKSRRLQRSPATPHRVPARINHPPPLNFAINALPLPGSTNPAHKKTPWREDATTGPDPGRRSRLAAGCGRAGRTKSPIHPGHGPVRNRKMPHLWTGRSGSAPVGDPRGHPRRLLDLRPCKATPRPKPPSSPAPSTR